MSTKIIAMMMGVSIFLGLIGLGAFLWGIKTGQFDDEEKFLNAVKFDGEDDLNDMVEQEQKRKKLTKKVYKPE